MVDLETVTHADVVDKAHGPPAYVLLTLCVICLFCQAAPMSQYIFICVEHSKCSQ